MAVSSPSAWQENIQAIAQYLSGVLSLSRSAATILNQTSAAKTSTGNSANLSVGAYAELALDVTVTTVTGTNPTLVLSIERLGADGTTYYQVWASSTITATGVTSTNIGEGMEIARSFGSTARLKWTIGGTSPSFTFVASIIGK